jgi:hypothetical protein
VFTAFCIHRVKDLRPDNPGPHARINLSLAWSRYPPKIPQPGQDHVEPDPSCLARLSLPVLRISHPGAPGASAAELSASHSHAHCRKRYQAALPISTVFTESIVNEVVAAIAQGDPL